jgi:hypothetical protein
MADLKHRGRDRCRLCGRPPYVLGVWVPAAAVARRLGSAAGRGWRVAYALCRRCARDPRSIVRVEDAILAEAAAQLARPEAN